LSRRLLVLKAGSGASNNLIRSLQAGDPSLFIVGCNEDRFVLRQSVAERNYLVPKASRPDLLAALRRIVESEGIDLLIPNSEADVTTVSDLRERLPCRTFLPRKAVIERCQDKYQLSAFLRRKGIAAPRTYPVTDLGKIEALFGRFPGGSVLWCRLRKGTGSLGAIPVKTPEHVRSWIRYWEEMCGVATGSFTLSEYLPGRDFCVQCLWHEGTLLMAKMHERLGYYVAGGGPSSVSSTAAFARTVFEPRIIKLCQKAIRVLDRKASGVFFVDLKENDAGAACITEINAGRFANVPTIHDQTGKPNMALAYVRLALGEAPPKRVAQDNAEECYVLRDLDTVPAVFPVSRLSDDIRDARPRREWRRRSAS
jgi:glutathione synthase/RimK-type ligase-like ATP-grasp enzyme